MTDVYFTVPNVYSFLQLEPGGCSAFGRYIVAVRTGSLMVKFAIAAYLFRL